MTSQRGSHSLVAAVAGWLSRERITGRAILVAFSGGPDSLALLHALHMVCRSEMPVLAAHLNHRLRSQESDGDQAFVEEFCRRHAMELHVEAQDVRRVAEETGANLEATARRLRYEWLAQVARKTGAGWTATGHTADDQAETLLHHLIRGTGLRGLRGIAPRRPLAPGIDLIRPLLRVARHEVLDFLQAERLSARQDASNLELSLTRNRIRHELLPVLRDRFNPEIVAGLGRLAEQADALFRDEEAAALKLLEEAERPRAGDVLVLDVVPLSRSDRNRVRELFYVLWEREGWPVGEMSFAHWDRLAGLVFDAHCAHDLPGVRAERQGRVVQLRSTRTHR